MNKIVVDFAVSNKAQVIELTSDEIAQIEEEKKSQPSVSERLMAQLRDYRNRKLAETDWSQGRDVPDVLANKYSSYRQQLRDITKKYNSIEEVVWPDMPT